MPMYEYICANCGSEFEELVMGSDLLVNCPDCKSDKVEKKLSTFSANCSGGSSGSSGFSGGGGCPKGNGFG